MADDFDLMYETAERRAQQFLAETPRAKHVRYDAASGRILIDLNNGCSFAFPARLAQGLETATDADLAAVEILGVGYGLHWDKLNVDLSIPGLLAGLFGTGAYMDRLRASHADSATSSRKAAAARMNGAKGAAT